jgi:uncharacterized protein DUF3568
MTWKLRALSAAAVLTLAATQSGCLLVAAAAGTGATVAYVSGDLNTSLDAPPDKVAVATKAAMQKLDISVISAESSAVDARVVGRTARDTRLTVTAKGSTGNLSQLSIRAGTFGDDALQARLLEEIKKQLGSGSASNVAQTTSAPTTQPMAGDRQ